MLLFSKNHYYVCLTYFDCVFVALDIQHLRPMRLIILSVSCPPNYSFPYNLINGNIFKTDVIEVRFTWVNQKVKAIFKLRGNRDREELAHCAVLTVPVEEFSHVQYSALPSVEWQQRGRKQGRSCARLHHRRKAWRNAVSLDRMRKTCGNSSSYVASV